MNHMAPSGFLCAKKMFLKIKYKSEILETKNK